MTVNAVAHHLNKRVLLVDFPSLQGKRQEGVDADADLRGLFRESDISNAVLFFDECENIFRQRESGGDRLLNALLTEIERYEGIVFLATNRPFDLDEAMNRRITAVFEFKAPDHIQRRKIWDVLLLRGALQTDPDIDLNKIALNQPDQKKSRVCEIENRATGAARRVRVHTCTLRRASEANAATSGETKICGAESRKKTSDVATALNDY
ncbi:hypothetical protein PsorP6_011831 [Peronosclerospora sorghi]|uniref:Uncharacterized protein n=1 Tax=Peronosclerospora sorghi TaxID=230839 RepID=A0ACC0WMC3_9STRA|nr:hypothetical protein PsorP6_011831 [Peronosclerospora sorghi]